MEVFIGWDFREDIAYQIAKYSLLKNCSESENLHIYPIQKYEMISKKYYWRDESNISTSTDFALTRFLTPFLSNSKWSLFIDCDFLAFGDIKKLFEQVDDKYAIMCVKHDYNPSNSFKMDGQTQSQYPRKNWSSCVLYNKEHPSNNNLTLQKINEKHPSYLHRFKWLNDDEIGELDYTWNFLEGWYKPFENGYPNLVHFTEGGPFLDTKKHPELLEVDYAKEWLDMYKEFKDINENK